MAIKSMLVALALAGVVLASAAGWGQPSGDRPVNPKAEPSETARRSAAFQRLVGGLGCGPATDLSQCGFSFDPRLERECSFQFGPAPGGRCFCPFHASAINVGDPPLPLERAR